MLGFYPYRIIYVYYILFILFAIFVIFTERSIIQGHTDPSYANYWNLLNGWNCIFLGPRITAGVHRCLFIIRKKRTAGKSDDKIFEQFMDQHPISSERSVNREVTVSPQLEVGCESFGVALEELCPLSLHHSQNGSDSNSKSIHTTIF